MGHFPHVIYFVIEIMESVPVPDREKFSWEVDWINVHFAER